MTSINLTYSILLTTFLFTGCKNIHWEQWDPVNINPNLSKDSTFALMDTQKELATFPEQHTTLKRSSMVSILIGEKHSRQDSLNSTYNTCTAYFSSSDTLHIDIGVHGLFGGTGFEISYHNKRFNTKGYQYSDVVYQEKTDKPQHWIIHQQLTLNQPEYKAGDSLYGYIDFKAIERNAIGDTIIYNGKGKFRAKMVNTRFNN
ncbi:hypothetical protein G7074_21550 [Pedobacter sp. HDW13]|nr:hypothetical protein [Pedobacter sp. HDW13]QIL41620.1 hypothetical protein G7074_21550 [Pedobacter sp. HDW13]